MSLKIEDKGKAKVVSLAGKMDVALSMSVESELDELINSGGINLILEISGVEYLSSSGIRVFITTRRKVNDKHGKVVLADVPETVKKILKTVDLEDLFEVYDSVDKALESF